MNRPFHTTLRALALAALAAPLSAQQAPSPAAPTAEPPKPAEAAPAQNAPAQPAPAAAPAESEEKRAARLKIDRIAMEKARLDIGLEIAALKARKERSADDAERAKLDAEAALRSAKLALEFADADEAKADAEREAAIVSLKSALAAFEPSVRARELETDLKIAKLELDNALGRLTAETARHKREKEAAAIIARTPMDYPTRPLANGVLSISDRRIPLNGPITDAVARRLIDRISFFNLRDPKAPIFVVIDNCPGGSLMSGYQVIQAINGSKAPVHVVVKGSAGGVASAIVAQAPHSHVFASSLLSHEQPALRARGNTTTVLERQVQTMDFFRRIYAPVAKKMGLADTDAFLKKLYEKNSDAEWNEFGENSVKLGWAGNLIERLNESSVDDLLVTGDMSDPVEFSTYRDASGKTRVELPPLSAGDAWLIRDPQGLYGTR